MAVRRQADVVVINLGTNDNTVSSKKKLTKTQFQEGATALVELVREKIRTAKLSGPPV